MSTIGDLLVRRQRSLVAVANEQVDILDVCRWLGMQVPEEVVFKSVKVRCPFGAMYHSDHGIDPAFRIYPETNSAYCFACAERYSPVFLAAKAWDKTPQSAAADLLEKIDYKPVSLAQAWASVQHEEPVPDAALLGLALRTYCARIDPGWEARQFDDHIARRLGQCLDRLMWVATPEGAREWLEVCKVVMRRQLRGTNG